MDKATDRMGLIEENLPLVEKRNIGYFCQYTMMTNIGRDLNRIEKFYQILLRVCPGIKRHIRKWRYRFRAKNDRRSNKEQIINECRPGDSSGDRLEIGDKVRIIPYSQIKSTLDDRGSFKRLKFQEPMEKYCNNTYEVLKIPQYVLNNGGRKINKCKDVVILRGLYCDGRGMMTHEGCDMSCLHYWKTDWLKKIV